MKTTRTDNEDHWLVDKDPTGLPTQTTVRIEFAKELEIEVINITEMYEDMKLAYKEVCETLQIERDTLEFVRGTISGILERAVERVAFSESIKNSLHKTQNLLAATERMWQRDIEIARQQCVEICRNLGADAAADAILATIAYRKWDKNNTTKPLNHPG
jgi:hypothetical protein